jgi:hypothetical protein
VFQFRSRNVFLEHVGHKLSWMADGRASQNVRSSRASLGSGHSHARGQYQGRHKCARLGRAHQTITVFLRAQLVFDRAKAHPLMSSYTSHSIVPASPFAYFIDFGLYGQRKHEDVSPDIYDPAKTNRQARKPLLPPPQLPRLHATCARHKRKSGAPK